MEPAESDRSRPWFLRTRRRRWWKRPSFWFLFIAFIVALTLFLVFFSTLARRLDEEEDSDSRAPAPCLRESTG